jgi:uncharacterized membrane protein
MVAADWQEWPRCKRMQGLLLAGLFSLSCGDYKASARKAGTTTLQLKRSRASQQDQDDATFICIQAIGAVFRAVT